ncbi:MAG: hypothetical protein ACFFC3_11900, partial [Candidatus Odinarchaeota archaeon]
DGDEYFGWAFKTNPLSADSDHDFLADTAEMQNYHVATEDRFDLDDPVSIKFETNCEKAAAAQVAFTIAFGEAINEPQDDKVYGIQNIPDLTVSLYKQDDNLLLYQNNTQGERYFSQVVDIRELIENAGLNYFGDYMITVDQTGTGAILEQFEVDITGYLNPNKADYDNDGIMDGVETGLLVRGYDTIDFKDSYMYDNLTVDDNPDTYDEFSLTIPYIGLVDDADLYLKVDSEGIPEGNGNITIQLLKEEINCNIDDAILINYFSNFNNISSFSYQTSIDLTTSLNNEDITEYYGNYNLKIIIDENALEFSEFTLSEFYIYTDTFVEANNTNNKAWYTNPAKKDTDGDGWSDHYEIFTKETNPLSEDTDADGVWDCYDRDPKRDVMLKISPVSASHPKQYKIKIVVKFTGDDGQDYCFITPKKKADVADGSLWSAFYDGTHGSNLDLHYYVDINDDSRILDSTDDNMQFDLEFWQVDRKALFVKIWDRKVIEGMKNYEVGLAGTSDTLIIAEYDGSNLVCQAKVKVETIGIEKANTIAIHRINETFNGHYQDQQKMNIIQLHITDTPSSASPFVKGVNNIVVPTDLFTETVLNGYIQNERLEETFFYSDDEDIFKFIAVDRESFSEQATEEIDFIMIRFDITAGDAEDLLDLVLTCIINDTTEEEAVLYTWCSTKINGTSATMMNLPHSVLEFIPWFCEFENSEQGSKPKDYDDWLWAPAKVLGGFIAGLIITALMLAIIIVALIVIFVCEIIKMTLLPILAHVLWLIVRAVLLIFFYILLAIEMLFISIKILAIGLPLLALSAFGAIFPTLNLDLWVSYGVNKCIGYYQIISSGTTIRTESWIEWGYWEFFDLYFPLITEKTMQNNFKVHEKKQGVINDENYEVYSEPDLAAASIETDPILFDHGFSNTTIEWTSFNFFTKFYDSNFEEPNSQYGVRLHLISPNGTILDYYQMETETENPDYSDPTGVVFNYTIDFSSYEEGLWHYFYTTKDSFSNNITIYPTNDYFVGPATSNSPELLINPRISKSNASYYDSNGWINDNFYFFIQWWDMISETTPLNISICLIPAEMTLGVGKSNTMGIKKFEMQSTDVSPNYSNPVEYFAILNFTDLGYTSSEIGSFKYYFEALTSTSDMVYCLQADSNESSHYHGPVVKPIDECTAEISSYILNGDNQFITSDTIIRYHIKVSDYNGDGLSSIPIITFTKEDNTKQYNFTQYYVSSDGTEERYYFEITGKDLEYGVNNVEIDFPDSNIQVNFLIGFLKALHVFNFLGETSSALSFTLGLFGIMPISLFTVIQGLAFSRCSDKVLYLGLAALGVTIVPMGIYIYSLMQSDDVGGLLGFSIACMLLFLMLKTCVVMDSNAKNIFESIQNSASFLLKLSLIVKTLIMLTVGFLPVDQFIEDILYFVTTIFTALPTLFGVYSAIWMLNSGWIAQKYSLSDSGFSEKVFQLSYSIYIHSLFVAGLIGLSIMGYKLGLGLGAAF